MAEIRGRVWQRLDLALEGGEESPDAQSLATRHMGLTAETVRALHEVAFDDALLVLKELLEGVVGTVEDELDVGTDPGIDGGRVSGVVPWRRLVESAELDDIEAVGGGRVAVACRVIPNAGVRDVIDAQTGLIGGVTNGYISTWKYSAGKMAWSGSSSRSSPSSTLPQ